MAIEKVHTTKGSTNGKRRAPRQIVKDAAKKLRRADDKRTADEAAR
jgi:hypothetical protein